MLAGAERIAAGYDVELSTTTATGSVARTVVERAVEHGADEIVVGTRDRSRLARIVRGSTAEAILRRASVPVTVVPAAREPAERSEPTDVLVPVGGPTDPSVALTYASDALPGASFTLLHVVDPAGGYVTRNSPRRRSEARQARSGAGDVRRFGEVESLADGCGVEYATVAGPSPWAILDYVDEHHVDRVIVKRRSRHRLVRALRESNSTALVRRSPVPVTVL